MRDDRDTDPGCRFAHPGYATLAHHGVAKRALLDAEVITTKGIKGEAAAIVVNERVGKEIRATMAKEGATLPENLPIEPPIAEVRKRLSKGPATPVIAKPSGPST